MVGFALALYLLLLLVTFVGRAWVQYRRTGDHGFRGFSGKVASVERLAGVLFVAALVAFLVAPISALLGLFPVRALGVWVSGLGVVLAVLGFALIVRAQLEMGSSWRVGVDPSERTEFVTRGLFQLVRNPIFSALGLFSLGFALLVPNLVSALGLVFGAVGLELQVRCVEEPFLLATHGETYRDYARRVGRFAPWTGRLRDANHPAR